MKRILLIALAALLLLLLWGAATAFFRLQDRHPGYAVDLAVQGSTPAGLRAGFAATDITPFVPDRWTDSDSNARFRQRWWGRGDTYVDGNDNGRFDPVWMAGFQNNRPAQGVHDPLWARTMVLDDSTTRLALVALDAIGFMSDDIIDIRKRLPAALGVDYLIVTSTHTHEGPDLLGLWGESHFHRGVDPAYLEYIKLQVLASVEVAVGRLRPARLHFGRDLKGAAPLVEDARRPVVLDPGLRLLQAVDTEADTTLGVLCAWANHPETLWNDNLLLSSDFPHYVREGLERGVYYKDTLRAEGLGGVAVYVNGAIGGLMTTSPEFGIEDPFRDTTYYAPSYDKARAQGERLALLGLAALRDTAVATLERGAIALRAQSIGLPLDNFFYRLSALLGIIDRGTPAWMTVRSEVAAWRLGPASFLHQPGELYPEILNGGVEHPPGADFDVAPVETPPLRSLMPGDFRFMVGLSNDMIGYIIPRSEWDQEAPYLYDDEESPYGEINSLGPETGPLIYAALREVLADLEGEEE